MNKSILGSMLVIAVSLFILSGCKDSSSSAASKTSANQVTFTIVDFWRTPIDGAEAFVDDATTATAGPDGVITLTLDGATNDVVFKAPNSRNFGFLNRDWSAVGSATIVLLNIFDPNAAPGTGTIAYSLSGGTANDTVRVEARARTRGVGEFVILDGNGAFSGTLSNVAAPDSYILVVTPSGPAPPAAQTDFGISAEFSVTDGATTDIANVPLVQGGREFTFTITGGLAGAEIRTGYTIYYRASFTQIIGGWGYVDLNVTSITDRPLTVPRNSTNLSGSHVWTMNVTSQDTSIANNRNRLLFSHFYQGATEFDAATLAKDSAFVDYGMSANLPAHDSASVSTTPTFGVTLADTTAMDYLDFRISRRDLVNNVWLQEIRIRDYNVSSTMSMTLPPSLTLATNSFYRYNVRARNFETNFYHESGKELVCYSTGATTPSAQLLCTP